MRDGASRLHHGDGPPPGRARSRLHRARSITLAIANTSGRATQVRHGRNRPAADFEMSAAPSALNKDDACATRQASEG